MPTYILTLVCPVLAWGTLTMAFAEDRPAVAEKKTVARFLSAEEIEQRINDLGADKFAVREAAMKELRGSGESAIGPLAKAAKAENLETTLRAVRILESFLIGGTFEEFEAAEAALEELKRSGNKAGSSRAETVLASMGEVREKRAIAAITRLNGTVKPDPRPFGLPAGVVGPPAEELMTTVVLNKSWKGGEDGLQHLEKLRFLRTVYLVEGAVPPAAIARLENKLPNIRVMLRGGGRLGVGGSPVPVEGGCEIAIIEKGSAADKAGLREGDIVLALDGKRGEKEGEPLVFDRLVELLKEHDAGEKVPLLILRNGKEQIVPVVLDEWK